MASQGARRTTSTTTASAAGTSASSPSPEAAPADTIDDFAFDSRPVVLYDGVCNFCNSAVNVMLDVDPDARFRMCALQSAAGRRLLSRCGRSPSDISSIVVVETAEAETGRAGSGSAGTNGLRHHVKSAAVMRIASGLDGPLPLLALFGGPLPPFLRDAMYDTVATNRYSILGKRDMCRLSEPGFADRFIST